MFTKKELNLINEGLATEYKQTIHDIDWWEFLAEKDRQISKEELENHLAEVTQVLIKVEKLLDKQ